ncbi:hypothetical protein NJB14191_32660 [Mycobacterium montefiorense]|nr:hypothetical protein NJB14191_32660 [Mycobacterium montefiorense]GKU60314.1 hypothetical protein NJB18182_08200 [Mycobacterium montefiorense]
MARNPAAQNAFGPIVLAAVEQAGPDELVTRYVEPTGRHLNASQLEWSADAEKI